MMKQQQSWNEGNIEKFMSSYWKSDSLMFIGKNGIQYGWKKTLDSYKKVTVIKKKWVNLVSLILIANH